MSAMLRLGAVLFVGLLIARPDPVAPDPNTPRPIAAVDSVFLEELTWMEIRDAMTAGTNTVIIATGGIEQNRPYLVSVFSLSHENTVKH